MKKYNPIFLLFIFFLLFNNCSKSSTIKTSLSTDVIEASITNFTIQNKLPTVVCSEQAQIITLKLSNKIPANGISVVYVLSPTLETTDIIVSGKLDWINGASYNIDVNNKIRKGEVYNGSIVLTSKNRTTNTQTIDNFKVVWE